MTTIRLPSEQPHVLYVPDSIASAISISIPSTLLITVGSSWTIGSAIGSGSDSSSTIISFSLISSPSIASFLMFIIPHTTNIKTTACSSRPIIEGQPVGVATHEPTRRRTSLKVSGFATTKNTRAEMIEMMSFCSCFLPLHPQPQSLKRPIILFGQKKIT